MRCNLMRRLGAAAILMLTAHPLWADNHALVVGASTYTNLDEKFWLRGPANDAVLVKTYLTTTAPVPFPEGNVIMLADGVTASDGDPTLQGIRDAFATLQAKLQPGDFVYLHFSGHGTQTPAADPDSETDGLDEMFLPIDIGPWDDTIGSVENGLVDDEIGALIAGLRNTGATVWAVFDACHSGTVTRGAPADADDVRLRKLAPDSLGVPASALMAADTAASRGLPSNPRNRPPSPVADAVAAGQDAGAFVAFYAAQTNETTPEKRLPRGDPERKSLGVFTYTLFETMAENPNLTYRQLGQEVLRKYAVQNLALSTPMFEGDLDAHIFSGTPGEKVLQWPVREGEFGLSLNAGALHGLKTGEILAVLPTAASATMDAIGYVEVLSTDTFSTELNPITHAELAAFDPYDLPTGSFARKLSSRVDFTLRVARPKGILSADVTDALVQIEKDFNGRLLMVDPGLDADVRLSIMPDSSRPDAIWMLSGSGLFSSDQEMSIPSVGTANRSGAEIATLLLDNLERMGRAINLMRMGGHFDNAELGVELELQTKNRQEPDLRTLDTTAVPILVPNDQVHVLAHNGEAFPIDANILHIGVDYSITHFFRGRLQPGDTLKKGLFRVTNDTFGRDRVVVILSPAEAQSEIEDLRFLGQSAVEILRGTEEQGSDFANALRTAGFGQTTRGAVSLDEDSGPEPVILQFEIDTVPDTKK
ncbi:hypothetical protein ASD8599_04046 [Ascidiaceihabitans donghaensis]|uniref:Peptidase C14 caspase domain-containing protein n=1 Tax=Ascidiaceihabitans donghaensis TaxID=1510460 RepID=A0A2R8BPW3_9RHOB|nr:caspase family protein [Ascidiaceihabitans donghaensis]SPH27580.1 hypothetical protein ASD8599_04046 [Ascidiaceihabitans donghaensis]